MMTPYIFYLFAVKLSLRFLLKAILIGTIALKIGIKSPRTIARIVALAVGTILKFALDELNK